MQIETLEINVIRDQLKLGQFQMYTGVWIGGNQDPIFLKDLFRSDKIPGGRRRLLQPRAAIQNAEVDKLLDEAINATDKATANDLYAKAQEMVSDDLPHAAALVPGEYGGLEQTYRQYQDQPERRLELCKGYYGDELDEFSEFGVLAEFSESAFERAA